MHRLCFVGLLLACTAAPVRIFAEESADKPDGKLRIIVFGAHPDDAELSSGGTAIKWARQGHRVKFVSVTNGDIGHWRMKGRAIRRGVRHGAVE